MGSESIACIQQTALNWCPLSKADSLLGKTNSKQGAHIHQPTAWPPPNRHVLSNITHAVAAMDSCFALIGAHQHGIAVRPLYGQSQCLHRLFFLVRQVQSTPLSTSSTQHIWELSWLGTAQQFSHDMRAGEGGSGVTMICVPVNSI